MLRKPVTGEKLIAADGTIYLVESVNAADAEDADEPGFDPNFYLVDVCHAEDAGNMEAVGVGEFDPLEFEQFCQDQGIVLL